VPMTGLHQKAVHVRVDPHYLCRLPRTSVSRGVPHWAPTHSPTKHQFHPRHIALDQRHHPITNSIVRGTITSLVVMCILTPNDPHEVVLPSPRPPGRPARRPVVNRPPSGVPDSIHQPSIPSPMHRLTHPQPRQPTLLVRPAWLVVHRQSPDTSRVQCL
jgi:hypothetical protein